MILESITRRSCVSMLLPTLVIGQHAFADTPVDLRQERLAVWHYKGAVADFFSAADMAKPPYTVSPVDVSGGSMVISCYKAGSLDYAFMSQVPALFAAQDALSFKLIAAVKGDLEQSGLLIPAGSPIRSVADLRGRRIGYIPATSDHYYLLKILGDHGLVLSDIQAAPMSATTARAAFSAGYLDGLISGNYVAQLMIEQTNARWLVTDANSQAGWLSYFAISARIDALADPRKRAAIGDYLKREQKIWDWIGSNPDYYVRVMSRQTGISEQIFQKMIVARRSPIQVVPVSDQIIEQQQDVADTFLRAGCIPRRVDAGTLWDRTYSDLILR
ncbi:ABC transporter substrate-binding protein [Acetobacter sp. DsW_063]|uniref:ABC transporter substrate-binding protein n=1 Tax=Acetobacter sp. DsW_063 TaxID=1514894 RepID=UPI000A3CDB4D|nr:ABC transporter substrate-binding protein [Acetobacter sp. DsW_063]OUJ10505.1 hypothetical protein HK28_05185 [Acetobacter sp. DsW_063]